MNTQVIPTLTFEEKLKVKIKDSIGDLVTDEDLTKLVQRSVEEIFFAPRKNARREHWQSDRPEFLPPLLHELVKEMLQPTVDKVIKEFIKEHNEDVLKVVKEVVTDGVGKAVISAMNTQFSGQLVAFQMNVQNQLNQK